jgi:hypothetical protein
MLVRVAPAADGELVDLPFALHRDRAKVLYTHEVFNFAQPILITTHAGFHALPGSSVLTMPYDPDIDQVREGCHERVDAGITTLFV